MKEDNSIESRVQQAMRSRVQHFKDLADSLTFEGVRRLLEKDLALDTYALDKHKKYVKQLLEKLLSGTEDDDNVSKQSKSEKVKKEEEEQPKEQKATDDDEEKIEDSPVMGLLSGNKSVKSENPKTQDNTKDKIPTEDMIKEAIWKKATYFRSKSEELTVAGVRRLIEEDLDLEKFTLDPFKKLISKQLDEVLNSENETPNKTGSKSDADSSHGESEDKEVEVKPKKKSAPKTKVQKAEAPNKRKKPAQETKQPKKKKMKNAEETSVRKKNVKDADEDSSAEKSESSAEKSEKKEVVAPVYGKKVERLKSIIKACGMSVAPTVYRKAKQAPEDKREAILVKELKEILAKEGLSANPSEKEIKEVKRKKERAKELEGIDTSNIVMGSRSRRSTFNFVAPPKPKAAIESDGDESEDSDNDDSDDSDNEDGDGDDQEVDDKDGDDDVEDDGDDKNDDDQEGDDKDGDNKDGDGDDDHDHEGDDKVCDDKDADDTIHDSKSEEMTGNDEIV